MNLGEVVRKLRKEKKWSLNRLSTEADVDRGNLSRFENGRAGLREDTLIKILDSLGVPLSEAYRLAEGGIPDLAYTTESGETANLRVKPPGPDAISVPVMNATGSMGAGLLAPEHDAIVDHMRLATGWIRRNLTAISRPANLAVLTAYGDSMAPTFNSGDMLLVDTGVSDLKLDAVYVLDRDGELFIKRVQRRMDGALVIRSDNPLYESFVMQEGELDRLRVLGRVVWAWNGKSL